MDRDYLPKAVSGYDSTQTILDVWQRIYGQIKMPKAWMGLNLYWPKFDIPQDHGLYVISWHTEYMDVSWLIEQCERLYPRPVLNITDWPCDMADISLDNLQCVTYDTFAQQVLGIQAMFGSAREIVRPKFKVSSLSHRYSQYKKFVTAYLMNKKNHDEMVLSWHAMIVKAEDLQEDWHSIAPFDLDYSMLKAKFTVNTLDEPLSVEQSTPPANSNWLVPAYQNALVNFTNESMNYSFTTHFGHDWTWPGPYLTEKTMKPLLAGRPFLAVGQYRTYDRLALLGFRSDFGWDISFDRQPGDRTRMIEIFRCIDSIFAQTIDSMFDQSIDACKHNLQIIKSGSVLEHAQQVNQKAVDIIKNL